MSERGKQKRYVQRFREDWLRDPRFRHWLKRVPGLETRSYCTFCRTSIGAKLNDLVKHAQSSKHVNNARNKISQIAADVTEWDNVVQQNIKEDVKPIVVSPRIPTNKIKWEIAEMGLSGETELDSSATATAYYDTVVPVQSECITPSLSNKHLIIPASIGFVGFGNMAQCLIKAFLSKGLVDPHLMIASAPSNQNLVKVPSGMLTTNDNNKVVRESDVIFLCVKPHHLAEVIEGLEPLERDHNPLFISIVAGFEIQSLEQMLDSLVDAPRVVRTVANTPCTIGQGCCVYTMGNHTTEDDTKVVQSLLNAVGFCTEAPEHQIDAVCGLAGSGPAYVYTAIEALSDGAVKMGLPRHLAQSLSAQMVKGAASMILETGKHPGQLKDEVCSPGGTTIAAMHTLEKYQFRHTLISAVETSATRSKELGLKL